MMLGTGIVSSNNVSHRNHSIAPESLAGSLNHSLWHIALKAMGARSPEFLISAEIVTSAADRGAHLNRIMNVSRHVDPRTLRTCIRRADLHKDHASAGFL